MEKFHSTRVTVMGLGHFGGAVAAARWLARQGARVTITDTASEEILVESLRMLHGEPIAAYHLGGHRVEDFEHSDLVVVNPAVRPDNPFLEAAAVSGVPIRSETSLFLEFCSAPVIGVTGTNGKSTTAAMTAAILRTDGRRVHLGGNIGRSLLGDVDQIAPDDWVVLEISSFQLHYLEAGSRFPEVAVVTNCVPNHLDWHGSFANYTADKQRILTGQKDRDQAVINTFDPEVAGWVPLVRGKWLPPASFDAVLPLAVPGLHNRCNAACAATAAQSVGCGEASIYRGLASYRSLSDRLEPVGVVDGRKFFNDSSSTTPESTIAALEALEGPIWLLAGGSDKGADFGPMCHRIAARATGAALYGAVADVLHSRILHIRPAFPCAAVATMNEAVQWCWRHSRPGESIVLSPGCASRDQFQNYRARGAHFAGLIRAMLEGRPE